MSALKKCLTAQTATDPLVAPEKGDLTSGGRRAGFSLETGLNTFFMSHNI